MRLTFGILAVLALGAPASGGVQWVGDRAPIGPYTAAAEILANVPTLHGVDPTSSRAAPTSVQVRIEGRGITSNWAIYAEDSSSPPNIRPIAATAYATDGSWVSFDPARLSTTSPAPPEPYGPYRLWLQFGSRVTERIEFLWIDPNQPAILRVEPEMTWPGALVTLRGELFKDGSTPGTLVTPGRPTPTAQTWADDRVTFVVPEDWAATRTPQPATLQLRDFEGRLSNEVTLEVFRPDPILIDDGPVIVRTGWCASLRGAHLTVTPSPVRPTARIATSPTTSLACDCTTTTLPTEAGCRITTSSFGATELWLVRSDGVATNRLPIVITTSSSPIIRSVTPSAGSANVGHAVEVAGEFLLDLGTADFSLTLNGDVYPLVIDIGAGPTTQLVTVFTPAVPTGGVADMTVTNTRGTFTLPRAFTMLPSPLAPRITAVEPSSGPTTGGTLVTITGQFEARDVGHVQFGGITAALVQVADGAVEAMAPPHPRGEVDVVLVDRFDQPDVWGDEPDERAFYYGVPPGTRAPPTLNLLSPSSGSMEGGTVVLLQGAGFEVGAAVLFDGQPTRVEFIDPGSLRAIANPHLPGAFDVTVINPDDQATTLAGGFTYTGPPSEPRLLGPWPWTMSVERDNPRELVFCAFAPGDLGNLSLRAKEDGAPDADAFDLEITDLGWPGVDAIDSPLKCSMLAEPGQQLVAVRARTSDRFHTLGPYEVTLRKWADTLFERTATTAVHGVAEPDERAEGNHPAIASLNNRQLACGGFSCGVPTAEQRPLFLVDIDPIGPANCVEKFIWVEGANFDYKTVRPAAEQVGGQVYDPHKAVVIVDGELAYDDCTWRPTSDCEDSYLWGVCDRVGSTGPRCRTCTGGRRSPEVLVPKTTYIKAAVPERSRRGPVAVTVRNPNGDSDTVYAIEGIAARYVQSLEPPTIASISPVCASAAAQPVLTIAGTGFEPDVRVRLKRSSLSYNAQVLSITDTQILARVPLLPAATYDVQVVFGDGRVITATQRLSIRWPFTVETSAWAAGQGSAHSAASLVDTQHDGFPDLFLAGATSRHLLANGGSPPLVDVASALGLPAGQWRDATWGDYDNDGALDVFLVHNLPSQSATGRLLRYDADNGRFVDMTTLLSPPPENRPGSPELITMRDATFADFDRDGRLDLLLVYRAGASYLYLQQIGGTFVDVGGSAGLDIGGTFSRADYAAVADFDGDLWPDIYLVRERQPNLLLRNGAMPPGSVRFVDVSSLSDPELVGGSDDWPQTAAWADVDGDGDMDLALVHDTGGDESIAPTLLLNDSGRFRHQVDAFPTTGLLADGKAAAWLDADDDGSLDLLTTRPFGSASTYVQVLVNDSTGSFDRVLANSTLIANDPVTGLAVGNVDRPGSADACGVRRGLDVIANRATRQSELLINQATSNDWVEIDLKGRVSNRAAIGARVLVQSGARQVTSQVLGGQGRGTQNDLVVHAGLGHSAGPAVDPVDVEVHWPSGRIQQATNVARNELLTIEECLRCPVVDLIEPPASPLGLSVAVRIVGVDLAGATGTLVTFWIDGVPQEVVPTATSATELLLDAPAWNEEAVADVVVTTLEPGATAEYTVRRGFAYRHQATPVITGIDPPEGATGGGQWIDIYGMNLTRTNADPMVYFDCAHVQPLESCTSIALAVDWISDVHVRAQTPPHPEGNVEIAVRRDDGAVALWRDGFDYIDRTGIALLGLRPYYVSVYGGETVRIAGTDFQPGDEVELDGIPVAAQWLSSNKLSFETPPHPEGPALVEVIRDRGLGTEQRGAWGDAPTEQPLRFVDHPRFALTNYTIPTPTLDASWTCCWWPDQRGATFAAEQAKWNPVFQGNGDLTFSAFLGIGLPYDWLGVSWGDIDGSGRPDAFLSRQAGGRLLIDTTLGDGAPLFADATASWALPDDIAGESAAFVDYDRDGLLDLYIVVRGAPNRLFRNTGSSLVEVTGFGADDPGESTAVAVGDYDADGWPDLFVANANDSVELYRNNRRREFERVTDTVGLDFGGRWSGLAVGDYDHDGWPDLFAVADDGAHRLWRNLQGTAFTSSVGQPLDPWGLAPEGSDAAWADVDGAGPLELLVAGHAIGGSRLYYLQPDDQWAELGWRDIKDPALGTAVAVAVGDANPMAANGTPDFLVAEDSAALSPARLANTATPTRWLNLKLEGVTSNRSGLGATVTLSGDGRRQQRFVESASGASPDVSYWFTSVDPRMDRLEVHWPSGIEQAIVGDDLVARIDRHSIVREPEHRLFVVSTESGRIHARDAATGARHWTSLFTVGRAPNGIAASHRGDRLFITAEDSTQPGMYNAYVVIVPPDSTSIPPWIETTTKLGPEPPVAIGRSPTDGFVVVTQDSATAVVRRFERAAFRVCDPDCHDVYEEKATVPILAKALDLAIDDTRAYAYVLDNDSTAGFHCVALYNPGAPTGFVAAGQLLGVQAMQIDASDEYLYVGYLWEQLTPLQRQARVQGFPLGPIDPCDTSGGTMRNLVLGSDQLAATGIAWLAMDPLRGELYAVVEPEVDLLRRVDVLSGNEGSASAPTAGRAAIVGSGQELWMADGETRIRRFDIAEETASTCDGADACILSSPAALAVAPVVP